ncbi:copper amine oxidase N-terminal domain-containing protein [Gorillibacterium sp. CAU 1737]|uniref:copper amine oxidase N-terminal domain-containing protein n=1 Tax=Gorillibacterium sp. CAU 1737 TaxID=3140362 RepID=UPI0032614966
MIKRKKTALTALLAATLLVVQAPIALKASAAAQQSPVVYIDGVQLNFSQQQPVVLKGRTLVPMRAIFEALGATVQYDGKTKAITATKKDDSFDKYVGDKTIKLQLDSTKATIQAEPSKEFAENAVNKNVTLDVPAQTIHNSTMVPLAFVGEALNCHVKWDGKQNRVDIFKPQVSESWYVQGTFTDELIETEDPAEDYQLEELPANTERVFLRKIIYGDQEAFVYHSRIEGFIQPSDEEGKETETKEPFKMQAMIKGVYQHETWLGNYSLSYDIEGYSYVSVESSFHLGPYYENEMPDLRYIPFSLYKAFSDAYEKGLLS